jgi:hypothetical protein
MILQFFTSCLSWNDMCTPTQLFFPFRLGSHLMGLELWSFWSHPPATPSYWLRWVGGGLINFLPWLALNRSPYDLKSLKQLGLQAWDIGTQLCLIYFMKINSSFLFGRSLYVVGSLLLEVEYCVWERKLKTLCFLGPCAGKAVYLPY